MNLLTFSDLVRRFAAQARAGTSVVLDFTVGSVFRALAEATAGLALWLQWLILIVLRQTRASTSQGAELDSFGADYGYARLAAIPSTGAVTFGRLATGVAATVPLGATVRTTDGTQSYAVVADTANAAWTGAGYALAASALAVTVPVAAVTAGSGGNVLAGSVTVLTSALPGIDRVTNAAPFANGRDAETDQAMRNRFRLFVDSRSRGTQSAVLYAVASLQQGLQATVLESPGAFTVVVDDGTGAPSSALIARVFGAVDAVRPVGTALSVIGPMVVTATISLTITTADGYSHAAAIGQVANAILGYVDTLGIGRALPYSRLAQLAYSVPGVVNAQSILLNGGTADVGGGPTQVVRTLITGIVVA